MHKDAKRHWAATNGHRCHACTAKGKAEDANDSSRGLFFTAVPDDGLMHAMADPVLTYKDDDDRVIVGASGLVRHVPAPPPPPDDA